VRRRLLSCAFGCLLALCLCCPRALAQAQADSTLSLLHLAFNLDTDTSIEMSPPILFGSTIGSGALGTADVQASFPAGENRGPQGNPYVIEMFNGTVSAMAPPPNQSFSLQQATGIFTFRNYATTPLDISVDWQATYLLSAFGDTSIAGLDVLASQRDLRTGTDLGTQTLIFDRQFNDGSEVLFPTGSLLVSLGAATTDVMTGALVPAETELRIDTLVAASAAVPEPGGATFAFSGALILVGSLCSRRRSSQRMLQRRIGKRGNL